MMYVLATATDQILYAQNAIRLHHIKECASNSEENTRLIFRLESMRWVLQALLNFILLSLWKEEFDNTKV